MKKKIINQLRVVLFAMARLVGMGVLAIGQLVRRLIRYLYTHRQQIMRHRLTLPALMILSVLWAGNRAYRYYTHPTQELAAGVEPDPTGRKSNTYFQLIRHQPQQYRNEALVMALFGWLGTPHRDGGESKSGTDCSGFVRQVYQEVYGIELRRNSQQMYQEDVEVIARKDLQEGDLVFFNTGGSGISHVGIYLQDDRFVHASTSKGVAVDFLTSPYFRARYYGSGRVKQRSE